MSAPYEKLQEALGYKFAQPGLLARALTHTSWAHEANMPGEHNERLEFLGDAVLELCVSAVLFHRFPADREGDLTRIRSGLVNATALAGIARSLGLPDELKLGIGEERQGGRQRDAILADVLEAVLAAIYLDGGFVAAQKTVGRWFAGLWPSQPEPVRKDAKTALQEECQRQFHAFPLYSVLKTSGPDHARTFQVEVKLPDGQAFVAQGVSSKKAEHAAAGLALASLNQQGQKK